MESRRQELSMAISAPKPSPSPPSIPTNDDIEAVIQLATSSADARQPTGKDTRTQLFVGNLPYRVRWQDLKDLFRKAGTVLRADVSLGPDNRSRGYGTVLLATAEDAGRAIDMFHGFTWQTRVLDVRLDRMSPEFTNPMLQPLTGVYPSSNQIMAPAYSSLNMSSAGMFRDLDYNSLLLLDRPKSTNNGTRTLFVGNLPFHCQWQDLKDLFRQAGAVVRADVALSADGRSRGFGTVVFASEADADHAVKFFNGYEYNGRILKVHHDRFPHSIPSNSSFASYASSTNEAAPLFQQDSFAGVSLPAAPPSFETPMHIPMPVTSVFDIGPPSGPGSPYDIYSLFYSQHQSHVPEPRSQTRSIERSLISSSTGSTTSLNKSQSPPKSPDSSTYSSSCRPNHPHPGHIALPPPPLVTSFSPLSHPQLSPPLISPHHLMSTPHSHHATPLGLPPITPSMPPFNFVPPFTPPGYNHPHGVATPSNPSGVLRHSRLLSPFSPGVTMSPGAFWGRSGGANSGINPAVGAPVHNHTGNATSASHDYVEGAHTGPTEYFPPVTMGTADQDMGYFPPVPPIIAPPLPKEKKVPDVAQEANNGPREQKEDPVSSPSDTDAEKVSSSEATSWHASDEMDSLASHLEDQVKIVDGSDAVEQEKQVSLYGLEGVLGFESHAPSRTLSVSPSLKKPPLIRRPESDP